MAGGSAATQIVVVHRGQVVVHQAVDVDQLDSGGGRIEALQRRAERFPGGVHEHRAQALAAAERAVAHGFAQARRAVFRDATGVGFAARWVASTRSMRSR